MDMKIWFLKLFSAFLRNEHIEEKETPWTEEEGEKLLQLATYHNVVAIIYEAAMKQALFSSFSPELLGTWRKLAMVSVAKRANRTHEFLQLYDKMKKEGLTPVVVKGMICRAMYPKPDYRPSGDEDLLIEKDDFWKMDAFLIQEGFSRKESEEELKKHMSTLHEVGYRNRQTGLYLEIHVSLFPEKAGAYGHYNTLFENACKNTTIIQAEGCDIATLCPTDHFLYLLCHSAKHFMHSGFGVRQLVDLLLFAEQYGNEIDWAEVMEKAKKVHVDTFLIHLLTLGVQYFAFDIEKSQWPQETQRIHEDVECEDLLEDLLHGGVFGASTMERLHSANITLAAAEHQGKGARVLASLFPSRSYMEKQYGYVKAHPWLLPVGWLHRFGTYIWKGNTNSRKTVKTGERRVKLLKKYKLIS